MKIFRNIIFCFIALFSLATSYAQTDVVKWKTSVEHVGDDIFRISFDATIGEGWHMYDLGPYDEGPYPTSFEYQLSGGAALQGKTRALSKSIEEYDEIFEMQIGYYETRARFVQDVKLSAPSATVRAVVEWMVCNDTSCLPLDDEEFVFNLKRVEAPAAEQAVNTDTPSTNVNDGSVNDEIANAETQDIVNAETAEDMQEAASETNNEALIAAAAKSEGSLWSIILEAILWGFAALVTPCVFPMVPMTVSFFMKDEGGAARGRFKALMYGIFIVAIYTLPIAVIILTTRFVGGDQVTADIFNWIATHWLPNIIFFIVFIVFAASFFGAFEITLPSWLVNKSDSKSDKKGLGGVFFMALTLVLVSFSCTGPIVSNVIVKSFAGEFWEPIITMLAFSIAFALPFTLFAFSPKLLKKLPKSGGWLNSVKVVLGFIEIALGLKFLSVADQTYHWGLLDREIYLAIWIVVFTLMGFYLLGKIRFKHDSDVPYVGVGRLALVVVTFTFVVYLIPGMFGAPLKALAGYLPPMHTQDFIIGNGQGASSSNSDSEGPFINPITGKAPRHSDFLHLPLGLDGFFDINEAEEYAASVDKPLFIDLTGASCVNCREMEMRVWSDPQVLSMLRNDFVVVALYLDDKKTLPQEEWVTADNGRVFKTLGKINSYWAQKNYGTVAQPYYIMQGRDNKILVPPKGYDLNIDNFVAYLQSGIDAHKAIK